MTDMPESEMLLLALQSMRDLVLIKGPNSRLLWANQAFLDYYGMSQEELRNLVDGPQSDPDDTLQYVRDDALVFTLDKHLDVPSEMVTDHLGVARAFQTLKSPMRVDGEVAMSVGVSRRLTDEEVTTSPSHVEGKALSRPLRLLTQAIQLPAAVLDVRGRMAAASRAWTSWFGPRPPGADAFFVEVYPDLASVYDCSIQALAHGIDQECALRVDTASGLRDISFKVGPWRYEEGSLGGVLLLAFDETRRVTQSQALREANERFDLVLSGSSVGIWDWFDVNRDEEYWSPRFYELLGMEPNEEPASLANFASRLHPDDKERTFALVDAHFKDGTPFDLNYRLRTKSGAYRWFRGTGQASRDPEGRPVRMAGSIQDIHDRVLSQAAIQRMNEDLEHFAHVAAHDLREPVRRQAMLIDFFLDDHAERLTATQREELELVRGQAADMMQMIQGFRALTGLSGPGHTPEILDLQELTLHIAHEVLEPNTLEAATIDLPRAFQGYRTLVDILLRNLLNNARAHGTPPLDLELTARRMPEGWVFRLANRWEGNPANVTDRYFQPFVAGRQRESSGLGLSICRRVAERHRGWIRLAPTAERFCIEFSLGTP